MKLTPRSRTILLHVALGAGAFLLAYLLVALLVLPEGTVAEEDVTVPAVVGLTQGDAQRRLTATGLELAIGASRFSADAPSSTVLSQNPAAGTAVARGTTITLDISAGQQRSTIPSLVGLTREAAARELTRAGLEVGEVSEQASDSVRGLVLASRPEEGQVVPAETRIDLVVSTGPVELTMPDVVGRELQLARTLLVQLGLSIAPVQHDSISTYPPGTVVAQSPAAGSAVTAGVPITLRVAGVP